MKNCICFILIASTSLSLYSLPNPGEDTMNVIALSGLKLRTAPYMESQVIDIIPFGQPVYVLEHGETDKDFVIEWTRGHWVEIEFEGRTGYVFSGFLTHLPLPVGEFEVTNEDLDITYPLVNWLENNFYATAQTDTIKHGNDVKITQKFNNGHIYTREHNDYHYKASIVLSNTKIMDVYHLLKSMLLTKYEINTYNSNSVFVENGHGRINDIRVGIPTPVRLRQMENGSTRIEIITYHAGC